MILVALGAVVAGSVLAALPLGFAALIAGRALQGLGIGLTPLAMATARGALPHDRSRSAVALLSITTVAGVGPAPPHETGRAMSFNLVLRYIGYSAGSALSAAILDIHTPPGRALPLESGYDVIAWTGCAL